MNQLSSIIDDLIENGEIDLILPVIKGGIKNQIEEVYFPQLCSVIENVPQSPSANDIQHVINAFLQFELLLNETNQIYIPEQYVDKEQCLNLKRYIEILPSKINRLHTIKNSFYQKFICLFEYYLACYTAIQSKTIISELIGNTLCSFCKKQIGLCTCETFYRNFEAVLNILKRLKLLTKVCQMSAIEACRHRISNFVRDTCSKYSPNECIPVLEQWYESGVHCWLEILQGYCYDELSQSSQELFDDHKRLELKNYILECYIKARSKHMFMIIIEYPESCKVLKDLKQCIKQIGHRYLIIDTVKDEFNKRLLHPGAGTTDILAAFINAIRVLRYLDSTGVMMELSCNNVKQYLARREDTIRVIVSNMNEHGVLELDELTESDGRATQMDMYDWEPEPIEALNAPDRALRTPHSRDMMSMLVSIYGHPELFVEEYVHMLADRLLSGVKVDITHEGRYVDLLKNRFGDAGLQGCDVMLKDYIDSETINGSIRKNLSEKFSLELPINALIISSQYWPEVKFSPIELPDELMAIQKAYTTAYGSIRSRRTLHWSHNY
ncbi:unnamed protein product, partial [Didymodactylos carnosus]